MIYIIWFNPIKEYKHRLMSLNIIQKHKCDSLTQIKLTNQSMKWNLYRTSEMDFILTSIQLKIHCNSINLVKTKRSGFETVYFVMNLLLLNRKPFIFNSQCIKKDGGYWYNGLIIIVVNLKHSSGWKEVLL